MALAAAVHGSRRVRLRLRLGAGEEDRAPGGALRVGPRRPRWYAPGYCHCARACARLAPRTASAPFDLLEDAFARPTISIRRFVQDALAVAPSAWHVDAVLDSTLDCARQVIPPHRGHDRGERDGVVLRLNVECLDDAARYLIRLGFPFVVNRPPTASGLRTWPPRSRATREPAVVA